MFRSVVVIVRLSVCSLRTSFRSIVPGLINLCIDVGMELKNLTHVEVELLFTLQEDCIRTRVETSSTPTNPLAFYSSSTRKLRAN